MNMTRRRNDSIRISLAAAMVLLCTTLSGLAASVTATLNRAETQVGGSVQLTVVVDGTTNASVPQTLDVEGLDSRLVGHSTQVQIHNFRMSTSAVYTYLVTPIQEGTFTIPPIEARVDGKEYKSDPIQLRVYAGGSMPSVPRAQPVIPPTSQAPQVGPPQGIQIPPQNPTPRPRQQGQDDERRIAFAELMMPRESAYVGEVIPIEFRVYFRNGYAFQLEERPNFSAEGLTVQRWSEPQRGEQMIGDAMYHVFTFRSAITPLKSGEVEIPPVILNALARVPSRAPSGFEDLFADFFGQSGFPGFGTQKEVEIASDLRNLEVKSLPRDGRPENFRGAVGDFTIASSASPEKADAGDPVTLNVTISGRGNFDAIEAPELSNADGWRLYPAAEDFQSADAIGFGGSKVFEYNMIAETRQTQTPIAEFSYFDPAKERYFTISTEPSPVIAAGSGTPAPTATAAATPDAAIADAGVAEATPEPGQPLIAESMILRWREPLAKHPIFWGVNGGIAVLFALFAVAALIKRRASSESGRRVARVKGLSRDLAGLRADRGDDADFYGAARDWLSRAAEVSGSADAHTLVADLEGRSPDAEWLPDLHAILQLADEARFAGGVLAQTDTAQRTRSLAALEKVNRMI